MCVCVRGCSIHVHLQACVCMGGGCSTSTCTKCVRVERGGRVGGVAPFMCTCRCVQGGWSGGAVAPLSVHLHLQVRACVFMQVHVCVMHVYACRCVYV